MKPKIVALCGFKGAGKSMVADLLIGRYGFVRRPFAGPIKAMLKAGFHLTDAQLLGNQKEAPLEVLGGHSTREAMQTLGTEWGRGMLCEDIWLRAWEATAKGDLIVIDDLRFPNELELVKRHGGIALRVDRPGFHSDGHLSESYVSSLDVNAVLYNGGNLIDLCFETIGALTDLGILEDDAALR